MKNIIMLLILAGVMITNAAQFEIVSDVKELAGDLTAQKYGYKDVNGQYCAILKIFTDIKDLQFKNFGYEKHDYKDGNYLVYMQPNSKNLTFMKDGFTTKPHNFPFKLQSNTVYGLELKRVVETIEEIGITVKTNPENAKVYIDGIEKDNTYPIIISIGNHQLKVMLEGFKPIIKDIEVLPENPNFYYKMEKFENLIIDSNPEGATAFINGNKLIGLTPISTFYPAGKYELLVKKDSYRPIKKHINISTYKTKNINFDLSHQLDVFDSLSSNFIISLIAGMNLYTNMFNKFEELDNKKIISYQYGIGFQFMMTNRYSFFSEISYYEKKIEYSDTYLECKYLSLPLGIKMNTYSIRDVIYPYLYLGSGLEFPLEGNLTYLKESESLNITNDLKTEFVIIYGLGLDFYLNRNLFIFNDFRYMHELKNTYNQDRNNLVSFMIGLRFI